MNLRPLLATTFAALALAVPAASANVPHWGMNDNTVIGAQTDATTAAQLSKNLAANSARITLNWSWIQPTASTPNFSTYDSIYKADVAAGIHPLIMLVGAPSWTWAPGTTCPSGQTCVYPPATAYDANWENIAKQIAWRYPQAAGIEIWNEPNQNWEWASGPNPARYTQLLKEAYTAIKSIDPSMPVIGGALAADLSSARSATSYPMDQFLQAMYNAGAKGYMDGISIHPYPYALDLFATFEAMSDATEVRDANHDSTPLWVTETGLSRSTFTPAEQSLVDAQLFRSLSAYQNLGGLYLTTMADPAGGGDELGLLSPTLSPYAAYCTVAAAAGSSYTCPSGLYVPTLPALWQGRWGAQTLLQYAANAAISYYAGHGSYNGLDSSVLHSLDSRLSATAADSTVAGSTADPSRILVSVLSATSIRLCNASTADLSYCTGGTYLQGWHWGSATGSAYTADSAAMTS